MADRVYPSSKQNGTAPTSTTANPAFPATKAQLYGATRPTYRPQPDRRRRRSRCCSCCLWLTLIIIIILLLAAVAGTVFYFLYRPHRPSFDVTSLKISQFNLTSSSTLLTKFNLTLTSRNPNKKLVFLYDPILVSVSSNGVDAGNGTFPGYIHGTKNTTTLRATIVNNGGLLDSGAVTKLKSDMKSKSGVPLKIELDTKVKVKIGGMKTNKVKIRVSCDGIKATVPTGKTASTASTSDAKCKVDLRIKIWKWTF